nr:molybdopterin oxidoreductase [Desulfobacterales bacterium]
MKLDRRGFIKFFTGAGAGLMLSPLPWKLTDDISIWTQNWPWTPVPPEGKVTYAHTACTLCPGGCGITVRKVEDRAIKIEGREDHPVNRGGICILGLAGLQLLYGPSRIKSPLKRTGNRGSGRWEKISWEEGISELSSKLSELRRNGEAHTAACILGSDRGTTGHLFSRFFTAYGSPNVIRTPSIQDTYEITLALMHGVEGGTIAYDLERADFIISFSSGLVEGWGSPVRTIMTNSLWKGDPSKQRARVVQVETRLSNTAAKADEWLPIRPGTDAALAMGLAHVIITKGIYDKRFVNKFCFGFEDWTDKSGKTHMGFKRLALEQYSPQRVSDITGISASKIVALGQAFAKATHPLAVCGRGKGSTAGSVYEFMAIHALNALVGNINRRGGVFQLRESDITQWPTVKKDAIAVRCGKMPRIDGAGTDQYPLARHLLNRFPEVINTGKGYPIKVLLVHDANPIYTMPDSKAVEEAFSRIPFIVSFSSYMDETAKYADLILPNHTYLERWEDVPTPIGIPTPVLSLARPVVKPQFDTRHVGDVLITLARTLGGTIAESFKWDDYETLLKDTMGNRWNALKDKGFLEDRTYGEASSAPTFSTSSGKFEFYATRLSRTGIKIKNDIECLPHYEPISPMGDSSTYPLILIPYESIRIADGAIGNPPFLTKTLEDTVLRKDDLFVEINPRTAMKYGFSELQYAMIRTPRGKIKVRLHLYDGIMPGILAMPKGLGHSAYDRFIKGKGVNFNTVMASAEEPVSGLDATWGIRAKLERV